MSKLIFAAAALISILPCSGSQATTTPNNACDSSRDLVSSWRKDVYCANAGTQASILANIARDTVQGSQASLFANIATEKVKGSQFALGMNYAREVNRQFSWNVNMAHRVDKLQLGQWNIADTVHGMQIGIVNISQQIDGLSLAPLTLSKNGLLHVNASTEETGMAHLTFASGHKLYTAFDVGYTVDDDHHPFSLGVGLGRQFAFNTAYLETEFFVHMIANELTTEDQWNHHENHGGMDDDGINHLVQVKLRLGQTLFSGIGVFAGLSYNALIHGDNQPLIHPWRETFTYTGEKALFWPGLEVGVRFGR